jgi:NAD(P) transhydrogenase subunit alpha
MPPEASYSADIVITLVENLFVFMLASFIGLELINGVSRLLHTPLMSLTNAISSIAIVGSLFVTAGQFLRIPGEPMAVEIGGANTDMLIVILGALAVACSSINAIGGFMITERILRMFRQREGK